MECDMKLTTALRKIVPIFYCSYRPSFTIITIRHDVDVAAVQGWVYNSASVLREDCLRLLYAQVSNWVVTARSKVPKYLRIISRKLWLGIGLELGKRLLI